MEAPLGDKPVDLGVLRWGRHRLVPLQTVVLIIFLFLFSRVIGFVGIHCRFYIFSFQFQKSRMIIVIFFPKRDFLFLAKLYCLSFKLTYRFFKKYSRWALVLVFHYMLDWEIVLHFG